MKIFKILLAAVLSLAVIISPFVIVFIAAVKSDPCYENTFVGALDEKYERLYSIKGEKIVVIGGSAVAFGLDSALIEKYTEMPVVNFGLYGSLGMKLMLDLSRDAIGEGDVVIVAPELAAQSHSLYFNSETTLQAFDGNFGMLKHVGSDNIFRLLSGLWNFYHTKSALLKEGIPDPDGVYNSKSFNGYGDIIYPRPENTMVLLREPQDIEVSNGILSPEFAEYLNEYTAFCERRGASVYYSFSPMNKDAMPEDYAERLDAFAEHLAGSIDADIITSPTACVYDSLYFYDTNFHLNDAGVRVHTVNLIKDILLELGIPKFVDEEIPAPPGIELADMRWTELDANADYFTFSRLENGGYRITGLSEIGKAQKSLTVPQGYNGFKVISAGANAFSGGCLEKLTLPNDTNLRNLEAGCFAGAGSLRELWIYYPETDILPPPDFFGVANGFTVHVPEDSDYDIGYYWSERNLTFIKDAN